MFAACEPLINREGFAVLTDILNTNIKSLYMLEYKSKYESSILPQQRSIYLYFYYAAYT